MTDVEKVYQGLTREEVEKRRDAGLVNIDPCPVRPATHPAHPPCTTSDPAPFPTCRECPTTTSPPITKM